LWPPSGKKPPSSRRRRPERRHHAAFRYKEEAVHELTRQLEENTAMLIKASHAMHFEKWVERLRKTYD
jgi:UDP-N-acetylmuramyl pentapeptide synthase